jgi:hypothetical protein
MVIHSHGADYSRNPGGMDGSIPLKHPNITTMSVNPNGAFIVTGPTFAGDTVHFAPVDNSKFPGFNAKQWEKDVMAGPKGDADAASGYSCKDRT